MKGVVGGLFVFMMMLSFVVAGSSSSTRADFYVPEDVIVEEDLEGVVESPSSVWFEKFIYWSLVVIAVGIFVKFVRMVVDVGKLKTKKVKRKGRRRKK